MAGVYSNVESNDFVAARTERLNVCLARGSNCDQLERCDKEKRCVSFLQSNLQPATNHIHSLILVLRRYICRFEHLLLPVFDYKDSFERVVDSLGSTHFLHRSPLRAWQNRLYTSLKIKKHRHEARF